MHTGAGVAAQRTAITRACLDRSWVLQEIIEDVGFSGGDLRRPGLREALARLDAGRADCLVVAKLDRLSRSLLDFAGLSERARTRGWGLIVLDLLVDTTTPAGEAMANVLATFAQFERRMISQRTKEARAELRAQSRVFGTVPYGYTRDGDRLIADPAQQKIIKQARGMYAAGISHEEIATWLNGRGSRGPKGGLWTGQAVKRRIRIAEVIGRASDQIQPEPRRPRIYPLPYGYQPRDGLLVEDPEQQAVLRRMRRLYARGMPTREIARLLTSEGIPTPRIYGKRWGHTTVTRCLTAHGEVRKRTGSAVAMPARTPSTSSPRPWPAPYGYRSAYGQLVPHRREQRVIARIFALRAEGISQAEIATRLNAKRISAPSGAAWSRYSIRHILTQRGAWRQHVEEPGPTVQAA